MNTYDVNPEQSNPVLRELPPYTYLYPKYCFAVATIDVPVDEELTKLKISEDWYTAFDLLFYKLQKKEALVKDERFLWKELLGSFIESHLPETHPR